MANILAMHSVGNSLITYLRNSYPAEMKSEHDCDFLLISSGQLADKLDLRNTLSLLLYRISFNQHFRTRAQISANSDPPVPLSLDLHYLLTVWSDSALHEQTIMAWAMRQLHLHPVLDSSYLSADAGWEPGAAVQLIPAELSNEELMRIWDTFEPKYRLSVSYVARVIRIDGEAPPVKPAIAMRASYSHKPGRQ